MPIKKVCIHCGKEFFVPPARKDTARFCSSQCKNEHGGWGKRQVELTCLYCGRRFKTWGAWLKKNPNAGKYCSRACKDKAQKRTDIPVSNFIKDYRAGLSSIQIASKYKVTDVIVRRRLHEANIEMRTAKEGILLAYKDLHGSDNKNWKGGKYQHQGYILVYKPNHHLADKRGYVKDHRLIWEQYNNCRLPDYWHVHHKNHKRDDNKPGNLLGLSKSNHSTLENAIRLGIDVKELEDKLYNLEQKYIRSNKKGAEQ